MSPVKNPLGFVMEEKGGEVAERHLTGLAKRGEDPRPAFRQITDELRLGEAEWFDSAGAGTWPRLSDRTLESKQRQGLPREPLVATGALRRSLTVKRGQGGIRSVTKRQMRFGSRIYYAKFHERGTGVPARPILVPLTPKTRRRMVDDIREHLLGRRKR